MRQVIPTFYPPLTDRVGQGMFTALRQIIKMRVLPSLSPLFQNAKLDKDLRKMLRERFSEFCSDGELWFCYVVSGCRAMFCYETRECCW